ncbi:MAG: dimethyl sulfoxide reductase anchor subunit, partial [Verrucomicrobiota bacterium]|nr:dimethyl sulfoxide reductase anchor subunit [Verrucomicrobiota bacterium]
MIALENDSPRTLIDDMLAEQQSLTAVERFSRKHESGAMPAQARYYRDLIPLEKPRAGEQYAFAVDLDACTGCKACVSACHSLNGLDEDEIWRNVGVIVGGAAEAPYQQTITTACHHCVEPGCLFGCPVAAYEKDVDTGIVRHLDDQCIGCSYCVLKCPYDVPKYSKKRGIVRKCDMCYNRLAADEAPACVQACPNEAITIRTVTLAEARAQTQTGVRLIHGAFDSSYTKPTTSYTTRKSIPANAQPGDICRLRLEHPHWPLIWMLLLSQISAGVFVCLALANFLPKIWFSKIAPPLALTGFAALQVGLVLSVFHLGKPLKAWRFFLGLRTSWMSREILVFGIFAAASAAVTSASFAQLAGSIPAFAPLFERMPVELIARATPLLTVLTAATAIAAVFCSAMIYVDTRRPFWSASGTFPKFFGTLLLLGVACAAVVLSWLASVHSSSHFLARNSSVCALLIGIAYAAWEILFFRHSLRDPAAPAHRSARTIWFLLRPQFGIRAALIAIATFVGIFAATASGPAQAISATLFFVLTFGSAIIERYC